MASDKIAMKGRLSSFIAASGPTKGTSQLAKYIRYMYGGV